MSTWLRNGRHGLDAALAGRIREAVTLVARRNGARRALLFGSHARGTATRHSDVDLLFEVWRYE